MDKLYSYKNLTKLICDIFSNFGFSKDEAEIITDVLITADLYGVRSHGVQRLVRYYRGIKDGSMKVTGKPELVYETPVSAVMDGHKCMGQLTGVQAMNIAIDKAEKNGIGMVTVRNSAHYGIAGYYAQMASQKGMIGFSCTNTAAVAVPTFGRYAMLGSNPIAISVPADPYPFLFDASTTVVARGKLEVYNKLGKSLPGAWAVGSNGLVTNDAGEALSCTLSRNGGLLPLGGAGEENGGYKGYGYGIVCELLSSILSLGSTCNHITIQSGGICHGFMALSLSLFGNPDLIQQHFSNFLSELRESPTSENAKCIYTPGEKEVLSCKERKENGIPVDDKTLSEIREIANSVNVCFEDYFE